MVILGKNDLQSSLRSHGGYANKSDAVAGMAYTLLGGVGLHFSAHRFEGQGGPIWGATIMCVGRR